GTAGGTKTVSVLEMVPNNGTTYKVVVTGMSSPGTVIASVPAGAATDAAGNGNTVSTSADNSVTYEPLTTTISLATGQADPANKSPINLAVVFSAAVTDFAVGDIKLTGTAGATTAVVTGSGTAYNVAVSGMTSPGTVVASLDADAAHNADGDGNSAASISLTFDNIAPTITITGPTTADECTRNCSTLKIAGIASDDMGLDNVSWSSGQKHNGVCTGTTSWSAGGINITGADTTFSDTFTVTATDKAGNTATDTLKVTVNVNAPGSEWSGLAMVSLPIIPDETDPKLEVGFYSDSWVMFDTSANDYVKYPDQLTWFVPADKTPGRGFWTRFGSTHTSPYGNIPPQNQEAVIHLEPGWNLIGNPFVSLVTWDFDKIQVEYRGIRMSLGDASGLVGNYAWGWNSTAGAYYLVYDKTVLSNATGSLSPWQAYWVKAELECDLILPAPKLD
ncbi:MAG: hypothetical protein ACYC64_05720, partial [Armatimonadota bacterium]